MPLQPLFQYVDRQNLERLQQLAEDITAHGVIRNNEFSEAVLIKPGDALINKALDTVIAEISALHRDNSPYEPTNPDYDETFADTHPNTYFVQTDGDNNYVPPEMESSQSIDTTPSTVQGQRFSEPSDLISALLLKSFLEENPEFCHGTANETIEQFVKYSGKKIHVKDALGISDDLMSLETFSKNIIRICSKYVAANPDLYR